MSIAEDKSSGSLQRRSGTLLISALVAALGSFLFGFDTAVISGTTEALRSVFDLNDNTLGFTVSSALIGTLFGALLVGRPSDWWGRRPVLAMLAVLFLVSAVGCAVAGDWYTLLFFRWLGGMWPNGVVLVSECWQNASRPLVAGIMGAGINLGILLLSQLSRLWPITSDSWRWMFELGALSAVLGILVLWFLPESPKWLATRASRRKTSPPGPPVPGASGESADSAAGNPRAGSVGELFRPPLLRRTLIGILLASIPLIGAWAGSKWMVPWADQVAGAAHPGYKAIVQGWWALGATLGSFAGAQVAHWLGRRCSYFLISLGTTALTLAMFQLTAPLQASFLPVVFAQGLVATLFFGWLPLYLPELFPTRVRATGAGVAMNFGRFGTAAGVLISGALFSLLGGSYPLVGAFGALIYAVGMIAIWGAPDTGGQDL